MIVVLNAEKYSTKEELHDFLAEAFHFPEWYGKNLDALYDCLSDLSEDTELFLLHRSLLEEHLRNYAKAFCKVLRDAAKTNPHLTVHGID